MFAEDELRPLSALQHLLYCERQCALIHQEQAWVENRFTAEGRILHQKADSGSSEQRGDLRIARSLALRSYRLGLIGRADVVELHRVHPEAVTPETVNPEAVNPTVLAAAPSTPASSTPGAKLPGLAGRWFPRPVEYKRGRPKAEAWDEVQLCAQALCLEEMLEVEVPAGALFYGQRRRRTPVVFDEALRALTEETASRLHRLLGSSQVPAPVFGAKCRGCSLQSICLPKAPRRSAKAYLQELTE